MKKNIYPIEILSIYGQTFSKLEQEIIQNADCIIGGKALIEEVFKQFEKGNKTFIPITSPLDKIFEQIKDYQKKSKRVLVLADGDALYFGIGASLVRYFGVDKLRIHAGVSIVQRLCAAVQLPWHELKHVSLHGRQEQRHWQALAVAVFSGKPVCLLTDANAGIKNIAKFLLSRGAKDFKIYVGENVGLEGEKIFNLSLAKAAKYDAEISNYCTLLIVPTKNHARPILGIEPTKIKREKHLMTKGSVRAAALSLLRIQPQYTVWDIGSGSGSVALEACALAYEGHVIAVEKNAKRISHMQSNRQRMNAFIMDIYEGDAADIIDTLAKPHAIFVGGGLSSSNAEKMLHAMYEALSTGGRMVISCVLLETLQQAEAFFNKQSIATEITQISINNSAILGKNKRLVPANPVFLLCVEKD